MRKRILVIDDQKDIREVYLQILTTDHIEHSNPLDILEDELFDEEPSETAVSNETPIENYSVDCASQGMEGIELVQKALNENHPYMVAFIDMRMPPGIDGKETAKRIREIDPDIELVIVTAFSDHLCSEIVDYIGSPSKLLFLKKPFDVEEIKQLATNLTEKWILNQQNKEYTENLEKMVLERTKEIVEKNKILERLFTMDILTELNNTQKFYDELDKELERIKKFEFENESPSNLVLAMLDIDNLKYYNEIFGHWNGDMILKTISEILKITFRKVDIIARIGGDEFVVIMPQTDINKAKLICDKLIDFIIGKFSFKDMVYLLDEDRIQVIKQQTGYNDNDIIQISITGVIVEYQGERTTEKLVNKVTTSLIESKKMERNKFHLLKKMTPHD